MDNDAIKTYSYRISQATRSQLVVITYDIITDYLNDAINKKDGSEYKESLHMAMRGIDQLITGLDMDYMKRTLISVQVLIDCDRINEIISMLKKLRAAFLEVSRQDTSEPMMKNSEKVYSGLTYSRFGANETAQDTLGNRGYKV